MCRMRSVRETAKFFKKMDPDTEMTEYTIRKMISEGTIQALKTGGKYLINLDLLLETLGGVISPAGSEKLHTCDPIIINK